jgi:hypothetical protein
MSTERANDLAQICNDLVRRGKDFPTVWGMVLKGRSIIAGVPSHKLKATHSFLDVPLMTGEHLVYDEDANEFKVE